MNTTSSSLRRGPHVARIHIHNTPPHSCAELSGSFSMLHTSSPSVKSAIHPFNLQLPPSAAPSPSLINLPPSASSTLSASSPHTPTVPAIVSSLREPSPSTPTATTPHHNSLPDSSVCSPDTLDSFNSSSIGQSLHQDYDDPVPKFVSLSLDDNMSPKSSPRRPSSSISLKAWLFKNRSAPDSPNPEKPKPPPPNLMTPSTTQKVFSRTRPAILPPKPVHEDVKHLAEYTKMLKTTQKLDMHAQRKNRKALQKKQKVHADYLDYWITKVLPNLDTLRYSDATLRNKWVKLGIPPRLRGHVWNKCIGNQLHITEHVFQVCGHRAQVCLTSTSQVSTQSTLIGREDTLKIIHEDIYRTFPQLDLFQNKLAVPLSKVLESFAVYRADIGYVQGQSYIAGLLLVNMDEFTAFSILCNMFRNKASVVSVFYRFDMAGMKQYFQVFEYFFNLACPDLYTHFIKVGVSTEFFLYEWFLSMFAKPLNLEIVHRVWDLWFLHGDLALFQVAVSILKFFQAQLVGLPFEQCLQDVLRLPSRIGVEYDFDAFWEIVEYLDLDLEVYRSACRTHGIEPPE